jgi:hypothetical protein
MVKRSYPGAKGRARRFFSEVFDLVGSTALGGLHALGGFVKRRGVDRKLRDRFREVKAPWATWRLDTTLRLLLDAHFAGVERIYHFAEFETEPLLCEQMGVSRLCDLTTLYRDLRRFEDPQLLRALQDVLQEVVVESLAGQDRVVLDIDSTVETLYGEQEGAAPGPNPHKRGRVSYHPLIARDRISDLIVHHLLRTGDTGTASDIKPFLHRTIDIVSRGGKSRTLLARLDSGFESDDALGVLERRGVGYVVKMRATYEVARFASTQLCWKPIETPGEGRVEAASFQWRRKAWREERRVVAVRRLDMDKEQGRLFDEDRWSYHLYVTNLDWPPEEVARFYDKRADVERTICELKNDLAIGHVPSASFAANAADLVLKVLARNLLILYRHHGLQLLTRDRVQTLRRRYLFVPGRIVRHAGRVILRLARHSPLASLTASTG